MHSDARGMEHEVEADKEEWFENWKSQDEVGIRIMEKLELRGWPAWGRGSKQCQRCS